MNLINWFKNNIKDIIFFIGLAGAIWIIYLIGTNNPVSAVGSNWQWIMFIMILFLFLASALITGNPLFGWLVNELDRMSLSRLQMFLWTLVILSAFITAVFANLHFEHYKIALEIAIPQELWLAMGISTTSLVGSGLILEGKKNKDTTGIKLDSDWDSNVNEKIGVLVKSPKPSLLDLISGEEIGNYKNIDLTRLQNLFFTFVLVGSYMASLSTMFTKLVTQSPEIPDIANNFPITSFPELGTGAITLLTISHAGYLAAKYIDKKPSQE